MKRLKLILVFIVSFSTLFLFSGCYTQFSKAAEPDEIVYEEQYEEGSDSAYYYDGTAYGYEDGYYDEGYYEEGYYDPEKPERIIIQKYYYYDEPFYVHYEPVFYDPYSRVSFHFGGGRAHWYDPWYYWPPRHSRVVYYSPHHFDIGLYFVWGYWDPWYATIYYPPIAVFPQPYWYPPCYDPWHPYPEPYYGGGHHGGHHGYDDDFGRREWGHRDPVVLAGNSGGSGKNGSNDGGRPPREATIYPTQSPRPATVNDPGRGSGIRKESVKIKEKGRIQQKAKRRSSNSYPTQSAKNRQKSEPRQNIKNVKEAPKKLSPRENLTVRNQRSEPVKSSSSSYQPQERSRSKNSNQSAGYRTDSNSSGKRYSSGSKSSQNTSYRKKSSRQRSSGSSSSNRYSSQSSRNNTQSSGTSYQRKSSGSSSSSSYQSKSSGSSRRSSSSSYSKPSSSGGSSSKSYRSSSSNSSGSSKSTKSTSSSRSTSRSKKK
jgi:hypothetical protein